MGTRAIYKFIGKDDQPTICYFSSIDNDPKGAAVKLKKAFKYKESHLTRDWSFSQMFMVANCWDGLKLIKDENVDCGADYIYVINGDYIHIHYVKDKIDGQTITILNFMKEHCGK